MQLHIPTQSLDLHEHLVITTITCPRRSIVFARVAAFGLLMPHFTTVAATVACMRSALPKRPYSRTVVVLAPVALDTGALLNNARVIGRALNAIVSHSGVLLTVLFLVRECASASLLATMFELKMKLAISSQVKFAVGVSAFCTILAIPCLVMLAQRRLVPLQVLITMGEGAVLGLLVITRAS